jgi:hypothetical protein
LRIKDYWEVRHIGGQYAVKPCPTAKLSFMWADVPRDQRPDMSNLQAVLDWLSVQHPQTVEWPVHFLQGTGTCNRNVIG